jgi:protein TonB
MSSHANLEMKEKSSLSLEWGIAIGLAFVLLMFELVPASELGRLSTRTTDEEMEAVEADLAYDDTVEEQQEKVEEEQEDIEQETEDMVEELETETTLSLDEETTGLDTAQTVSQSDELEGSEDEGIGPPRFMPAEVLPTCTYRPVPEYPDIARRAGVEGTVVLWVHVDKNGQVRDVQLFQSSGVSSLDQAAQSAAWDTRWTPAQNNGVPVGVWTTLNYRFTLGQ